MTTPQLTVRAWKAALACSMLVTALATSPARAQSDSDLRKQNQELTTRVKDLETELDAARKQIDTLQKQVAAMQQQLAAARSGGAAPAPLEEPKTTIDESKANASPRALFNAAAESYKKAVADTPMGVAGDRDRIVYMRKIEKWAPAFEREYRAAIDWVVRVVPDSPTANAAKGIYTFVAVDPVTDAPLGDEFNVTLSRALATRLAELESHGGLGALSMKGTVVPTIAINPARETRGSFDNPRFVGAFAEYTFTVDPQSITAFKPAPPPATQPHAKPAAPAAPPAPEK